jgi:nucleolar protein 56
MAMMLITTWFGTFLLDGKQVADSVLFPKEAKELAARLRKMEKGELLDEEKALAGKFKSEGKGKKLEVLDRRLSSLGELTEGRAPDISHIGDKMGFKQELLHEATMFMGREKLGELGPDKFIAQAIDGLEELTKTANLLTERLTEWYGLHYPELTESATQKELVELVAAHGSRTKIEEATGKKVESFGTPLSDSDELALKRWASMVKDVLEARQEMEGYITRRMEELAPNLSAVIGPLLAARLVALTGGMQRLGKLPSSTIQLLGAEKALFQYMMEGGRPPKHGVLFQHPLIHRAPMWQRGKMARALAASASLAARADAFGKNDIAESVKAHLQKKVERIQKDFASPPARRERGGGGRAQGGTGRGPGAAPEVRPGGGATVQGGARGSSFRGPGGGDRGHGGDGQRRRHDRRQRKRDR